MTESKPYISPPHKEKFFLEALIDFAFDDDAEYYKNLKVLSMFAMTKRGEEL